MRQRMCGLLDDDAPIIEGYEFIDNELHHAFVHHKRSGERVLV
jgi:hypothetical protein